MMLLQLLNIFIQSAFAQEKDSLNVFVDILGKKGVMAGVGILFFFYSYKNSIKLFNWIEDQTYGTRDYILKKCELLHIEIEPTKVTWILLFMSIGFSIIVFGLCAIFGKFLLGAFLGAIFSFIGWKVPRPFMDYLINKRIKAYSLQMVDGLNLLANGLRAGLTLQQSCGMVVDELPAPINQEFNLILQQSRIGVPLEEALENLVVRVPTQDNEMFVTAVNILRESGGNLAEVFDTIIGVIRERVRLQQKIDTFVAQGKFQGLVLFSMPFAMLLIYYVSDPNSVSFMFTNPIGLVFLFIALILDLIGGFVIIKMVEVKV
jgi:tight adherence protein B